MKTMLLSVSAAITFSGCAATPVRIPGEDVRSKPLPYPEVSRFLESREHVPVSGIRFQRDAVGSKLFISFFFRKGDAPAYRTLIVTGGGIREIPSHPNVWYDDHENPVFRLEGGRERYEDEGTSYRFFSRWEESRYVFKNGDVIPYKEACVAGVSGGDYVLVQFKREARPPQRVHIQGTNYVTIEYPEKTAWILSRIENPRQPILELPKDFEPQAAYASNGRLILFDIYRPQGDKFVRRCLIYQQSADGFRLAQDIPIPWMGGVLDFWPDSGTALIDALNNRHMYPTYYRFNIETKRREFIGLVPADDVLFLKEDVIRTLDAAMGDGK
ncbi:MAG: hypothetical protein KIS67_24690 [Verrucomicrobiae bacterium]|nr:hypothetical protein [Verrucomicrobiae bacterium]